MASRQKNRATGALKSCRERIINGSPKGQGYARFCLCNGHDTVLTGGSEVVMVT
ncbi:hypothetical protein D3C85_1438370 [compost metagenome]